MGEYNIANVPDTCVGEPLQESGVQADSWDGTMDGSDGTCQNMVIGKSTEVFSQVTP